MIKTCIPSDAVCWTSPKALNGKRGYVANGNAKYISAILNNGTSIYMWVGGPTAETSHIQLWIDIDGPIKGKNTLGTDVFGVHIIFSEKHLTYKKGVNLTGNDSLATKETLTNDTSYGCSKDVTSVYAGRFCGALIQYDGWKIPDDYPVKF